MAKQVLLLGASGKMGIALNDIFSPEYTVIGKNSKDFNAADCAQVTGLIEGYQPDIVINAAAFLGIDPCEKEPERALRINTLYPKLLAELSREKKYLLIHFSTDGVFDDRKGDFYYESDTPCPVHVYGLTKYGGDCFVQSRARCYYIIRVPILFGESPKHTQFVEKMLQRAEQGQKVLRIADDIISSPTYSKDIAVKVKEIVADKLPYGLYHVANEGKASLLELMREIVLGLNLDVRVERASHKEFSSLGLKNTYTPLRSEKIGGLRSWPEAVKDYCSGLRHNVSRSC